MRTKNTQHRHPKMVVNSVNDEYGAKLADFPTGLMYHYERGEALYRLGEPMPKNRPYDENANDLPCSEEDTYLWMGWMCERARHWMKRKKVKDSLEDPDPTEPRPRKAA